MYIWAKQTKTGAIQACRSVSVFPIIANPSQISREIIVQGAIKSSLIVFR